MKKVILVGVFLSVTGFIFAQSGAKFLRDAYSHYSNEYYDRAKTAIDKCLEFDDTKADAKTWLYRGNIYLMIEAMKESRDSNRYKNLCDNCTEIAYEAYMNAFRINPELEVTAMRISTSKKGLEYCSDMLVTDAYKAMGKENYEQMYQLAKKAHSANKNNSRAVFCLGYAAEIIGKKDEAKSYYQELVKEGERTNMYPYIRLANIYREEDNAPDAVKTIEAGAPIFLQDTAVNFDKDTVKVKQYIDYAVAYSIIVAWAGRSDDADKVMEKALQKDPTNHILLINIGSGLNTAKRYDEAEMYFKRALDLRPNDVIVNYNLGNCYYNKCVDKYKSLDTINNNDEYERAFEAANEILKQARPYLEKAHELDPKDVNTLIMLRYVYVRGKDKDSEEKLKEVNEQLNNLLKKQE